MIINYMRVCVRLYGTHVDENGWMRVLVSILLKWNIHLFYSVCLLLSGPFSPFPFHCVLRISFVYRSLHITMDNLKITFIMCWLMCQNWNELKTDQWDKFVIWPTQSNGVTNHLSRRIVMIDFFLPFLSLRHFISATLDLPPLGSIWWLFLFVCFHLIYCFNECCEFFSCGTWSATLRSQFIRAHKYTQTVCNYILIEKMSALVCSTIYTLHMHRENATFSTNPLFHFLITQVYVALSLFVATTLILHCL